jgi:hypothetical protein
MEPAFYFVTVLQYLDADSDWLLAEAYVCLMEFQYIL